MTWQPWLLSSLLVIAGGVAGAVVAEISRRRETRRPPAGARDAFAEMGEQAMSVSLRFDGEELWRQLVRANGALSAINVSGSGSGTAVQPNAVTVSVSPPAATVSDHTTLWLAQRYSTGDALQREQAALQTAMGLPELPAVAPAPGPRGIVMPEDEP